LELVGKGGKKGFVLCSRQKKPDNYDSRGQIMWNNVGGRKSWPKKEKVRERGKKGLDHAEEGGGSEGRPKKSRVQKIRRW